MQDPSLSHSLPRLGLLAWDLLALAPPDPLDPLVIYPPALAAQQRDDPPVAVAAVGSRQTHGVMLEIRFSTRSARFAYEAMRLALPTTRSVRMARSASGAAR